jgi:crotonobetaine/carnitine-CoA ligase
VSDIPQISSPEAIRQRAGQMPDRVALSDTSGRDLTFAALYEQTLRWADALRRHGVAPGDRVANLLPNVLETSTLWIALGWLHAVDVSINTAYQGDMLRHILTDCGARILFVDRAMLAVSAEIADAVPDLELIVVLDGAPDSAPALRCRIIGLAEFLDGAEPSDRFGAPRISTVQGIVYTSGTTGASKGVLVHWGRHQEGVRMFRDWITADDTWFSMFPACHNSAKIWMRIVPFLGCRAVLSPSFRTQTFLADATAAGATCTLLLPNMLHWLLMTPPSDLDRRHSLREIVGYGPELVAFGERFGVPVHVNYGNTEGGNTLWHLDAKDTSNGYSGRAHPPFYAKVVDDDDLEVPVGEAGELVVRCDEPWMMFSGYFNMPEATLQALRNGWYHTGDTFHQDADDGFWFLDRRADYIRRRGENISSYEVERFVLEHESIREAAAIGVPDRGGEDEVKLCVVLADGHTLDPRDLIGFLGDRMPAFMVPRYVEFFHDLPKTAATKRIRKVELREDALNERTWDREVHMPRRSATAAASH